jgi:hypothetical protein
MMAAGPPGDNTGISTVTKTWTANSNEYWALLEITIKTELGEVHEEWIDKRADKVIKKSWKTTTKGWRLLSIGLRVGIEGLTVTEEWWWNPKGGESGAASAPDDDHDNDVPQWTPSKRPACSNVLKKPAAARRP